MCNSPATFQSMMDAIFLDMIDDNLVIIYSRTQTMAILSFGPVFVNAAFSLDISYIRPKMTLVSNKKKGKQKKASTYGSFGPVFGHRRPPQPISCLQSSIDGI